MSSLIRRQYLDTPNGQIHLRHVRPSGAQRGPTLVCLHPSPYSGVYFETAMPQLSDGRRVVAPDYPGYGGSYGIEELPAIEDYAQSMIDSVLDDEDDVDLLGFHSGCLVAVEMAVRVPDRIRQLVLVDAPFFDRETQQKFYDQVAKPLELSRELDSLAKAWDFNVASRDGVVPLPRAVDMFVDQLSSGARDYYCFHAAFTYDCIARFSKVSTPCTVVATQSPLHAATIAAAAALPQATLIEEPEITTSVFEQGAQRITAHVLRALDDA